MHRIGNRGLKNGDSRRRIAVGDLDPFTLGRFTERLQLLLRRRVGLFPTRRFDEAKSLRLKRRGWRYLATERHAAGIAADFGGNGVTDSPDVGQRQAEHAQAVLRE